MVSGISDLSEAREDVAGGVSHAARCTRPSFLQDCAVPVSYSSNGLLGRWRARGRYLARGNASMEVDKAGFSADAAAADVASKVQQWQSYLDPDYGT